MSINVRMEEGWKRALSAEFDKLYFEILTNFVRSAYQSSQAIYPPAGQIFRAFDVCPFEQTKVVILGQDPYHEPGQAEGLAFSVPQGIATPPSLRNILSEIQTDLGQPSCLSSAHLGPWAEQGVLLLNATLTVAAHQAASHQGKGWETFTDAAIQAIAEKREHIVFMLWGSYARRKAAMIDRRRHLVLEAPHPSPLSAHRGFFGCKHFSRANAYLTNHGITPIRW
ncbi:MAG: uracil-DNA glycosylase [Porphyromonas sp.]|nr:uracil-DNA glycosylase [Porphyromonas sp.]